MKKILLLLIIIIIILSIYVSANGNIVQPRQVYSYNIMEEDIKKLSKKYSDIISYHSLGKTPYNQEIYAVKLGNGKSTIFINGSHHAREWITTTLIMSMIEYYAKAYENNEFIDGYNVKEILNQTTIYFVPMVNPDGVTLQQTGLSSFPKKIHNDLLKMNEGSKNFERWKANIEGIDLNRQYNADWETINNTSNGRNYQYYKGEYPLQAIEAKLLVDFTKEIDPELAVSYHSTGNIVYWYYYNDERNLERDYNIGEKISYLTDYDLVEPEINLSGGGYTDWFIQEFNRPGYTIEVGEPLFESEVPLSEYTDIWDRNKSVGIMLANEGYQLSKERNRKTFNQTIVAGIDPILNNSKTFTPIRIIADLFGSMASHYETVEVQNNETSEKYADFLSIPAYFIEQSNIILEY